MSHYPRNIRDVKNLQFFLQHVIGVIEEPNQDNNKIINNIVTAELGLDGVQSQSTLMYDSYRNAPYITEQERLKLRTKIFEELSTQPMLDDDDAITLGTGGALPISGLQTNSQAYYIIGLPASGKSGICSKIAEHFNAVILDSDFAKRKIPEYNNAFGASITHDESTAIIFGDPNYKGDTLLGWAIERGANIVIPKIGHNIEKVTTLAMELNEAKYTTHLILVRLDRVKATQRAYHRFIETQRYVPLSMIFDMYANDPTIVYYDLKRINNKHLFKSYTMISTDVERGESPIIVDKTKYSPIDNSIL